ncbi:MAG: flagellar biosynthesis protein FliQ [Sphingomonadaceae bacterium]
MGNDLLYDSARQALWVLSLAVMPALLPALLIGLIIGLIQAATSINEMTLTFVPKLIGVFLALALFGGITGGLLLDFTRDMMAAIPQMAR